jgi:hypothetical protein
MSADTAFEVGRLFKPLREIADTLVASQKDIFVRLPGLYEYYPMGIRDGMGQVMEHGSGGPKLAETGSCPTGYDGNSFVHLGNGTNYLSNTIPGVIDGTETWISSSMRGLTIGGWVMADSTPASLAGIVSRWGTTPNRGYALEWLSTNKVRFVMSGTGANAVLVESAVRPISAWTFIVGRFTPSTEVAVFVDGDKDVNTTAIPASIYASTQDFEIGRVEANNSYILHGKVRDVFVCAAALSDELIEEIRATSAP